MAPTDVEKRKKDSKHKSAHVDFNGNPFTASPYILTR